MEPILRLAVWSGPRNISTAFMRAWENRPDTHVCDEPLYAHYLHVTGLDHPGRDEVIASQSTDWRAVVRDLTRGTPPELARRVWEEGVRPIWYQKHMSHHLLADMGREWLDDLTHVFLLREPRAMLASLEKKLGRFDLRETGLPQQLEILEVLRGQGRAPIVVEARQVLEDPERTLRALCRALGVPFRPEMLAWPAGPRPSDGVWAKYWYDQVWRSTGFGPYRPSAAELGAEVAPLLGPAEAIHDELARYRLRVEE